VQPLDGVQQQVQGELELELLVAAGAEGGQVPVGGGHCDGGDGRVELILALACIGTAVALFPVVRRVELSLALGFVCSRTLEAGLVVLGVVALLRLVTVSESDGHPASSALVAVHDWAFLLGPGLLPAVNALLLGTLLLRSGRVPRAIPLMGLVGAPLLMASAMATVFGAVDQVSTLAGLAALPVAAWEISLGVWLLVRGLRPPVAQRWPVTQLGRVTQ
jgi:hypothetical protein